MMQESEGGTTVVEGVPLHKYVGRVSEPTVREEVRTVNAGKGKAKVRTYSRQSLVGVLTGTPDAVTTGTIDVADVRSETVREFWVVGDDGQDRHVVTKAAVTVGEGHPVTLLIYNDRPAVLLNANIGQWWPLPEAEEALLSRLGSLGRVSGGRLIGLTIGAIFAFGLSTDSTVGIWWTLLLVLVGLSCVLFGPFFFVRHSRARRRYRRLLKAVGEMLSGG